VLVLATVVLYFYFDGRSVDAHLARGTQAKLTEDHATVIREYRRALALEDDPHTHKLLAIELAQTGQLDEAVSEFRLAQQGGEPISCPEGEPKCEEVLARVKSTSR